MQATDNKIASDCVFWLLLIRYTRKRHSKTKTKTNIQEKPSNRFDSPHVVDRKRQKVR